MCARFVALPAIKLFSAAPLPLKLSAGCPNRGGARVRSSFAITFLRRAQPRQYLQMAEQEVAYFSWSAGKIGNDL